MIRPRLAMTASLVPQGSIVADIGSDHAYLPQHLVSQGICPHAIAADIGEGPLRNAEKTVRSAGLADQIELRQSDGFSAFTAQDANCWVLAGMGGTLMVRLLDQVQDWICAPGMVIVAQCMRHAQDLRQWLSMHGFCIICESACCDAGRYYAALRAEFDGTVRQYPPGYAYYGELHHCNALASKEVLRREHQLLRVQVEALRQNRPGCEELAHLEEALHDFSSRCL